MQIKDLFLEQLDAEARKTRRAVAAVPEGFDDWRPHAKSMPLGQLVMLVAGVPAWFGLIIRGEELDVKPADGPHHKPAAIHTSAERVAAVEQSCADARAALMETSDQHLMEPWRLLEAGKVMMTVPRHEMLRDTFMHLAHHRGQLTVYIRMTGGMVPAIYGPSADESRYD